MATATRRVSRKQGLPPISDYEGWPPSLAEKEALLKKEIVEEISKKTDGASVFFAEPNNCFYYGGKYGFSFGISKFDKKFNVTLSNSEFRYKDTEVFAAIAAVIKRHEWLSSQYKWDRGHGVFVFNLFVEE